MTLDSAPLLFLGSTSLYQWVKDPITTAKEATQSVCPLNPLRLCCTTTHMHAHTHTHAQKCGNNGPLYDFPFGGVRVEVD